MTDIKWISLEDSEDPENKDQFLLDFVHESNKIDPQPGHENNLGDPHFDKHMIAAGMAVDEARFGHLSDPLVLHSILMHDLRGMQQSAGQFRQGGVQVGGRFCPLPQEVPILYQQWMNMVQGQIPILTKDLQSPIFYNVKQTMVWNWHVAFEHIHPFIDGNGRTGRLLMLNHALILGLDPWITEYDNRMEYYKRFQ